MALELASFREQSSRVIQECFTPAQKALLAMGMPYLEAAPGYADWVNKRRDNVTSIFEAIRHGEFLQQGIEQQAKKIESSRMELIDANTKRDDVDREGRQVTQAYEEQRRALTDRAQLVGEELAVDRRIALLSCKNPLLSKMGGYIRNIANWGRHALHCMVPVLAVAHNSPILSQTVAQSCSSLSLPAVAQCAATVATTTLATCLKTSFLVPLVACGAFAFVCSRVHQAAERVFGNRRRLTELNNQLSIIEQGHQTRSREFEHRKTELSEQIQKGGEEIAQAEQERLVLENEKTQVNADLSEVQVEILGDIAGRSLDKLSKYGQMGLTEPQKREFIPSDMMNVLDAVFLKAVQGRNMQKAIAQGPALPAIAASAIAQSASKKPEEDEDIGIGLGDSMSYLRAATQS